MTIAIFDLDRTLTRRGTWTPFLLFALRHRPARWIAAVRLLPVFVGCALGRVDRKRLKEASMRAVLAGMSRDEIGSLANGFVDRIMSRGLRPGAVQTVERHKTAGDRLVLATASIDFYAGPLARRFGIEEVVATMSTWTADGRLIAEIQGENIYGRAKFDAVAACLPEPRSNRPIIMYSDHISDLPLLKWADRGVAVNPTRRMKKAARALGMEIADWSRPSGARDGQTGAIGGRKTPAR